VKAYRGSGSKAPLICYFRSICMWVFTSTVPSPHPGEDPLGSTTAVDLFSGGEIKSLTLPRIELWQVSVSFTKTAVRLVATASISSHSPFIRGVWFLIMVEIWSTGRTTAWGVCCASENILQQFEYGTAQNRVSIKRVWGTTCWRNDQRTVFVKVMFCQNTASHFKSLCSLRFGGDNDYLWRCDKCNVAIYH